jgi:hypothetical protein
MKDIPQRLQYLIEGSAVYDTATIREAKAEIERLTRELDKAACVIDRLRAEAAGEFYE